MALVSACGGGSSSVAIPGSASGIPPDALFSFSQAPHYPAVAIDFDASASSDSDGAIASYAWDFGDSGSGDGQAPSHAYAVAGTYSVTLTVSDNEGATHSVSRELVVLEPN